MGAEAAQVVPLKARPHVLYRMYDSARQLLYVGITANIEARFADHRDDKPWWSDVSSIDLQHFTSREAVERAEQRAIKAERPLFNVLHRLRPSRPAAGQGPPKRHRNFRIEDEVWFALARIAELRGERTSEVMRQLAKGYVARHRKLLADDPVWQARRDAEHADETPAS